MRKSFGILTVSLAAVALSGSLTGCVVAPAQPVYGYGYDYYQPGYAYYPSYVEPSIGIGFGFGDSDGDRWHGHGRGHGGWHDRH